MEPDDTLDEVQEPEFELEEVETEGQEADSESSPDTEEVQEKKTKVVFDEEQQKRFNEEIYEERGKRRASERQIDTLNKQIKNLEQRLPQAQRPVVPAIPDAYSVSDAEFKTSINKRDAAIAQQAAFDAQQKVLKQQAYEEQQRAEEKKTQKLNEKISVYAERAVKLGIPANELQAAGETVAEFGVQQELVDFILEDDLGPAITKYLSQNVAELDNLRSMSPAQAAVRIDREIREKAAALKPKVNAAPDPVDTPNRAASAPKGKGPKGATFE
jgi:chromosome segregation ATPase